jgi:uncharacterized protein YukE
MEDPTRHLVEPSPADPTVTAGYANPLNLLDVASPAGWLNYSIAEITGFNVLETIVKPFVGDWAAFSRFGDALNHLAPCMQDIGANIQTQLDVLDASWDGQASDAAYTYFNDLASRVSQLQTTLRQAAVNYERTATGVWQLAQQLANVLQSIVDQAVIIVVAAALGTALVETGVGPVVGYGIAAWRVVELFRLINQAMVYIQTGGTIVMGFFGYMQELNWQAADLSKVGLPGNAYSHPAAAQ